MVVTYTRREIAELANRLHSRGISKLAEQWMKSDLLVAAALLRKWLAHHDFADQEIEIGGA